YRAQNLIDIEQHSKNIQTDTASQVARRIQAQKDLEFWRNRAAQLQKAEPATRQYSAWEIAARLAVNAIFGAFIIFLAVSAAITPVTALALFAALAVLNVLAEVGIRINESQEKSANIAEAKGKIAALEKELQPKQPALESKQESKQET